MVPVILSLGARQTSLRISIHLHDTLPSCSPLIHRHALPVSMACVDSPLCHVGRTPSPNLCLQFSQTCLRFVSPPILQTVLSLLTLLYFLFFLTTPLSASMALIPSTLLFLCSILSSLSCFDFRVVLPGVPLRDETIMFVITQSIPLLVFFLVVHVLALNERDVA